MATQSAPHSAAAPASAIPTQAASSPRPASGLNEQIGAANARTGAGGDGSAPRPASLPNGSTDLVASGNLRVNESGVGSDFRTADDSGFLQLSAAMERLPVGLVVSVPVRDFRVRNLLAMAPDELIETQWGHGEDLPLSSGEVQLAWSEFEVVDTRLAVRVTRLA